MLVDEGDMAASLAPADRRISLILSIAPIHIFFAPVMATTGVSFSTARMAGCRRMEFTGMEGERTRPGNRV